MVPVEAQAAGCPVVAYGRGGALDSVDPTLGNVLFPDQTVDALAAALASFPAADPGAPARRAAMARFAPAVFRAGIAAAARRALAAGRR
jgi:glycosyltransferase involved in cell wall biosynthesis